MKKFLLTMLVFVCGALIAREVTPKEAVRVAEIWAKRNTALAGETFGVQKPMAVRAADGTVLYYKVMLGERGMVIVSGDTNIAPVIAALPEATSPEIEAGHPLNALLLSDMTARRALLVASGSQLRSLSSSADVSETIAQNNSRWDDLLGTPGGIQTFALNATTGAPARVYSYPKPWATRQMTHWSQTSTNEYVDAKTIGENTLYNFYLPKFANGTQVTNAGCVAIAGAAILEFFQVPGGPERVQAASPVKVNDSPRPEHYTIGGEYNWSCLPTWTKNVKLETEAMNLLGKVPYDLGVLVEMNYKNSGSAAGEHKLADVLTAHYKFYSATSVYTAPAKFASHIYPQVRAGAPVFLSINDGGAGGHAVVAVGYGEDDRAIAYTRVFMGWGGAGDAWYALPNIRGGDFLEGAGNYNTISSVITNISLDRNAVALCGRVTNAEGLGVPYETVTVQYQALNESVQEERVITTGLYGEYAVRVPPATRYTVVVGRESKIVSTTDFCPPAINFELAEARGLSVYTDAQEALDTAIQEGKLLFVLSGPAWDADCAEMKKTLVALGAMFTEHFVFYYNDTDYGLTSMNVGEPGYAIFDPRTFLLSVGAEGNVAVSSGTGSTEESICAVLSEALGKWSTPTIECLEIQGLAATLETASYTLRVTYDDGVSVTVPEVTWSVVGDATIDSNGTLTITGTGNVRVIATVVLHGEVQTAELPVRKVDPSEVVSIEVSCADSIDDTILDLEETPWPTFTCTATLSDETVHEVTASSWSVSESATKLKPEIKGNQLNYAAQNAYASLGHTLTVTATYGDCSASANYTVYGYATLSINKWEITPQPSVPGGFSQIKIKSISYNSGGKTITTSNTSIGEYRLIFKDTSTVIAFSSDTLELAIPLSGNSMNVFLESRKKNGKNPNYSRTGEIVIGVEPGWYRGQLGVDKGAMPYEWLRPFFPEGETITQAQAEETADEDYDCDGYANWKEYVLGTDPQDAESTLRLNLTVPTDGGLPEVTWNERPGRTYKLLGADSLSGPWGDVTETSRFFKVSVEMN